MLFELMTPALELAMVAVVTASIATAFAANAEMPAELPVTLTVFALMANVSPKMPPKPALPLTLTAPFSA